MTILHIYRGLPGSGKTTEALKEAAWDGGRVVGRDHIRRLLNFPDLGSKAQEDEVTRLQERLIVEGLRAGQNVHVDDQNLRIAYVRRLLHIARREGAAWTVFDLTNVSLATCLLRNGQRPVSERVPEVVIVRNYDRLIKGQEYPLPLPKVDGHLDVDPWAPYQPDTSKPEAVLVDIDGTVALHDGIRGHHDYQSVGLDAPNKPVITAVRGLSIGSQVIFVSGRPESCRQDTKTWLQEHVVTWVPTLFMRETGDTRPDWQVKLEIFNREIRDNYNVLYALDDRNQVVDMYRDLGLTVLQVAPGAF